MQDGYKSSAATEVPKPPTLMEQFQKVFKEITTGVQRDISKGNYFSQQVLMFALPIIFLVLMIVSTCFISSGETERPKRAAAAAEPAAPAAPETDADSKKKN